MENWIEKRNLLRYLHEYELNVNGGDIRHWGEVKNKEKNIFNLRI